ncbi:MAG TPA: hypothetical protein VNX18_15585 [Bryobacteraceae bacterium]|nr:hypothetical protein [Bryobacteraceae bacterium]
MSQNVDNYQMDTARWSTGRNVLMFAALVSIILCVVGYLSDPTRFFRSYIVAFAFTAAVGLGSFFFVMVQYLTGSAWSVTVRRIMENIMVTLPLGAILFIPVAFGLKDIYSWTNPAVVAASEALKAKSGYLSQNFFLIRTYVFFALWSIWIWGIYSQSTKQDTEKSVRQMYVVSRWCAPGLFLVVVVGTFAAFDWLMSVEPAWYSTIFGLYVLSGGALTFFAIVTLVALGFRRAGILTNSITMEHYHDLGKWMFAMTAFYTYIAFSQYLLIWYANLPEETIWYRHRMAGGWFWIAIAMPFIRFIIPFFTLLCRPAKRSLGVIALIAVWSIVVEYVDLYWVVMPAYYKDGPQIHWLDFATLAATVSLCGLVFWSRFKKHKMVPVGDLRFEQSLNFENA